MDGTNQLASAAQPLRQLQSSIAWKTGGPLPEDLKPLATMALQECDASLTPAGNDDFKMLLTPCLSLVGAVGMSEVDRREWLKVAWTTLKHLPRDLLEVGCARARVECDHSSKIVPTIWNAVKDEMERRKGERAKVHGMLLQRAPFPWEHDDKPMPKEERCTEEQAAAIMEEFGLKSESKSKLRQHLGPPRNPTREDYIAMGVDPADIP